MLYPIVFTLFFLLALHYFYAQKHFRNSSGQGNSLVKMSLFSGSFPLYTFICFSYVFLQGGSSVAQSSSSKDLWSFWYQSWNILILLALPFGIIAAIVFFKNLNREASSDSFFSRLYILLTYPICYFILLTTIPVA